MKLGFGWLGIWGFNPSRIRACVRITGLRIRNIFFIYLSIYKKNIFLYKTLKKGKPMKTKHFLLTLLVGFVGGLIVMYFWLKPNEVVVEPINHYHTDTMYLDWPGNPEPLPDSIKPKTVVIYKNYEDSLYFIRINDSLQAVIDTLSLKPDTVFINDSFLTLFPKNPKLISLDLTIDSLSITLLDRNAKIQLSQYPLQLNSYIYRFTELGLSAEKVEYITFTNPASQKALMITPYVGYSFFSKNPIIGSDLSFHFSRITLSSNIHLTIENKPTLDIRARVGYPFKLWPRE